MHRLRFALLSSIYESLVILGVHEMFMESVSATAQWTALKADVCREYEIFTWGYLIKGLFCNRTLRVVLTMRLCKIAKSSGGVSLLFYPVLNLFHKFSVQLAGVDFSWITDFGPGLKIVHGWGLVINPKARIGENVTLFHGVTIGGRDQLTSNGELQSVFPTLENNVWVGPHALIIGGVTVGHDSRIAGGAFVTENIPPYSTVVGNPAVVVKIRIPSSQALAE